jgi:serine/threonine protein kinase
MTDRDEERTENGSSVNKTTDETRHLDRGGSGDQGATDYVEPHKRTDSTSGDRYLIGETLGEGGMAIVQKATDVQLQRPVAVKRLRPEYAAQTDIRQRFFAEAEILASLDHPGTTSVFEAGLLPDGDCFYAMKKVRGKTLGELMNERIPDDLLDRSNRAHFIEIFIRVCQAVAAAHNQGIIHRDLKPENIMVDDLGVVYVMDWGLAKQLVEDDDGKQSDSQRTRIGAVMGTPAYMSPEQASGHAAESDRQTDVFSLGVMLYEILTGVNPFRGETAVDSMKGVMYHEPEPPRKRNPRVSRVMSPRVLPGFGNRAYKAGKGRQLVTAEAASCSDRCDPRSGVGGRGTCHRIPGVGGECPRRKRIWFHRRGRGTTHDNRSRDRESNRPARPP